MSAEAFRVAIQARGMTPPQQIEPGRIYRFPSSQKTGDTAGWCKLFDDCRGGVFGDWREGWHDTWQEERTTPITAGEREALRRQAREAAEQRETEAQEGYTQAAARAATLWQAATPAPADHPYLVSKMIQPHGIRFHEGTLVVPVRTGPQLQSLQFIAADGTKRFLSGGKAGGGYFSIGRVDTVLCIAEGFATAATIHEATGLPVAVAFNAGNLLAVAKTMRERFPDAKVILCADDDIGTEGNPGINKACAAAEAVSGFLAIPDFGSTRPDGVSDFNDLARHAGSEAVRHCIEVAKRLNKPQIPQTTQTPHAVLIRGDGVKPEAIDWVWDGWLAAGKFHVLAGSPGTGKTTIALALAATITRGAVWPDGTRAEQGSCVIWSGEDDPKDTLAPRLLAMGADMTRIHFVGGVTGMDGVVPFDPSRDVEALSVSLERLSDITLLIVDPIVMAVAGDSHKNAETRRGLAPLVELAAKHRCALVGITHLSKGTAGRDPTERVTGSLAFGALARVVLLAAKQTAEDEAPKPRILVRAKSNIGPDTGGFEYDLHQMDVPGFPGLSSSAVVWAAAIEGSARDILANAELPVDGEHQERRDAADWLREAVTAGPVVVPELKRMAKDAGLSWRTLQRAMAAAGVVSRRTGYGQPSAWSLSTPQSAGNRAKFSSVAPFAPHSEAGATGATGQDAGANGVVL